MSEIQNNTHSGDSASIMKNVIGVFQDSSNRIGYKHLEEIIDEVRKTAPISRRSLVARLRVKILIDERYIRNYLDGLEEFKIIKIENGMILWNFNDNSLR